MAVGGILKRRGKRGATTTALSENIHRRKTLFQRRQLQRLVLPKHHEQGNRAAVCPAANDSDEHHLTTVSSKLCASQSIRQRSVGTLLPIAQKSEENKRKSASNEYKQLTAKGNDFDVVALDEREPLGVR